ncbi:glycoside hydrolase family 30 protein [Parabacteroides sp. FAFU027]|uniref:glycoside hydrolase family 30 protein n=1 Tax=Parabacteroides sp. FAFU027 TaxID=2922715 RepID=UPI001FAF17A4|nr:glycoside hydrolase family 30 beta sandwich domain-containing protein [Parabacteroides sp. FAFU027]
MRVLYLTIFFAISVSLFSCAKEITTNNNNNDDNNPPVTSEVGVYVTNAARSLLLKQMPVNFNTKPNMSPNTIVVNPEVKYQQMDGFGAAITGSSCYNLLKMTAANRAKLLKETFDTISGNGYSFIRISLGCSDFSMDEYTCCDTKGIENFALHAYDKRDLLPVLKEILAINPKIKILASPWTCPRWMKVNNLTDKQLYNSWTGGHLNPDYYQDYATYFVKFIQAMKTEGIDIYAVTVQNEPLNAGNSASMLMYWTEQRDFIKTALGPAFKKNNIQTKIIAFDHNYNYDNIASEQSYPVNIYNDSEAAQYIDGAAYHAYGGDKAELLNVHNARPDKNLYFTEMSIGLWGSGYKFADDLIWNMREVCLGTINNWSKAVMVWNFMLDDNHAPYRPGGCNMCLGAIDINSSDYVTMTKNSHFYTISHLAKVITPGAYRIGSSGYNPSGLTYSAFLNPDGSYALVLLNENTNPLNITISQGVNSFTYSVPAMSVVSYKWKK